MQKVIFLDFDGVMTCGSHAFPTTHHEGFEFYPKSVENLKALIQNTNAKIVVTSTYRRMYKPEMLRERFLAPYELDGYFGGITPAIKGGRGQEISAIIKEYQVGQFVIFDDLPISGFGERFIQIHPFKGITGFQIEKAAELLNDERHLVR